jgi:hypothetical protein
MTVKERLPKVVTPAPPKKRGRLQPGSRHYSRMRKKVVPIMGFLIKGSSLKIKIPETSALVSGIPFSILPKATLFPRG